MRTKNIVVIDDEEVLLKGIKFFLTTKDYNVIIINNGREALDIILDLLKKGEIIDLIITDILMSELTGIDLIKVLNELNVKIPIIIITGFTNGDILNELKRIGNFEVINKPFDKNTLLEKVEIVLSKHSDK
ncbi:MAG: response regulator [Spirochaetes bacterium]|nr:response regulator [Spirochaetota bacterium]